MNESTRAKRRSRSAVTSGRRLLIGGDPNSAWSRRYRDLVVRHAADMGGRDTLSEAQLSLVRRAAALECELEAQEARMSQGLDHKQLAFLALRSILDQIHFGWDKRRDRRKKDWKRTVKNPDMLFRVELGQSVRDELEFAGLLAAKRYVKAARNKHAALGRLKFRRVDWTRAECAQVGDWLWDALAQVSCFDTDERGFPCFHADHKAAMDKLAEEVLFDQPLYKPKLTEPLAWTSWRMECPGDIGATFVKANDPERVASIQTAFEDGSIEPHARAVSAIQRVPLKINAAMLPLVREFAGDEYRRDVVVAEALVNEPRFYNRVRCDRRGRLIQVCDFNYTRGDPVRSVFMFAEGKPLGQLRIGTKTPDGVKYAGRPIDWLEIAIANAHGGVKGTWADRHKWVANNHELIKAVSVDPGLIWRQGIHGERAVEEIAAAYLATLHGEPPPRPDGRPMRFLPRACCRQSKVGVDPEALVA